MRNTNTRTIFGLLPQQKQIKAVIKYKSYILQIMHKEAIFAP